MKAGLLIGLGKEWIENNLDSITENIEEADIVWIIAPWTWKKLIKNILKIKRLFVRFIILILKNLIIKKRKIFIKRDKYVVTLTMQYQLKQRSK